jgi:putative transposase
VWSWDISKLGGPAKWTWYYLDTILDIYSRYAVGWMVPERESAALAERLLAGIIAKQDIGPGQLAIHADAARPWPRRRSPNCWPTEVGAVLCLIRP